MKELWLLFSAFFRIGAFTFGGGYSMLPMLQKEVVERHGWATEAELLNYFAVGQCAPGVIAVNTAVFVGYHKRRVLGGIVAALGVVMPSLIIIIIIAALLSNFAHYPAVQHAFAGIRVAVTALIVSAVIRLFRNNVLQKATEDNPGGFWKRNWFALSLCTISFVLVGLLGASPVYVIVGAVLAGIAWGKWGSAK